MNTVYTDKECRDNRERIQRQLESKTEDRSRLEDELETLQREIEALETMSLGADLYLGEAPVSNESQGLTNAIRKILAKDIQPMRPTEIRNELRKGGFDIDGYQQPMAVLHTTLRRLKEQGEIEMVKESGKICYQAVREPLSF